MQISRSFPGAFRTRLLTGVALAATVGLSAGAVAQEQSSALEEIVITGSRIARPNIESNTPVTVLGEEFLQQQGFENFADIATTLPQFAPSFGASRTQSTFSGAATSGLNTANLRNLGTQRSVVLINGRRVPGGTTTSTTVDFNTLPTANVERFEVITGGASAIYGADAVAGVINIITKQDFRGLEVGASYGISEEGDNKNPSAYVMYGADLEGKGHVLLTLEAVKEGKVSCADRYLCAEDFAWFPPADPVRGPAARSGVGLGGRFFVGSGSFVPRNGSFTDANGNLIPFSTAIDGYNRNADRTLAIPTERLLFAGEASYEIADGIEIFAEANYGSSETDAPFEGHPFQSNAAGSLFGGGPGVAGLQPSIPVNNPFIPQALRNALPATQTEINWWQRFNVFDTRGAENLRQTVRGVAGVRGDFELGGFGKNWNYEASYVYGRTNLDSQTNGLVATDRLYYGLRVEADPANPGQFRCTDAGARAAGCIPINPFAPYTQAMKDYLEASAGQRGVSKLQDAVAFVSGSPIELPAGDVGLAFGVENRSFSGFLDYDEQINRALVTGNQIGDTEKSKIEADEVFGELIIPVLKDMPFAHSLTVEGAYRYSDSNVGGDYDTWRYGGDWAPIEGFRLRAVRARAVRAPNPGELGGIGQTFGVVNDPCTVERRNANATRAANCAADGVPADYDPPLNVRQSVGGFVGGNPDLSPETAITLTYGFVATPTFLSGFSLTVDRFEIEMDNLISTVGRQLKADKCYDTTERAFCADVIRGPHPLVGGPYALNSVNDQNINVASTVVKGIDFEAAYGFDIAEAMGGGGADYGSLNLRGILTHYDKATYTPLKGEEPTSLNDAAGGDTTLQGYVKWTGNFSALYNYADFTFNWNMRYIGSAKMAYDQPPEYPRVGATTYHNARIAYNLTDGIQLYAGVTNVFDNNPPFFASGTSGTQALDTVPAYYDVFGRSYYAGFKANF